MSAQRRRRAQIRMKRLLTIFNSRNWAPEADWARAARVTSLWERPAFDNAGVRTYRSEPHAWSQ
jgi:hypothetical protein